MVGDLIDQLRIELSEERNRKSSLENRALTASAAAAASVALLLGLGKEYSGRWQPVFFAVLLWASIFFVLSAVNGWRTARVMDYKEIDLDEYDEILEHGWKDGQASLRVFIADMILTVLRKTRELNNDKAKSLDWTLRSLWAGAVLVTFEIGLVLIDKVL